jgi:hypothetical protein
MQTPLAEIHSVEIMQWGFVRKLVAVALMAIFPLSAMCADVGGAMLYVSKAGMVNGAGYTRPTAIFADDIVQLPAGSTGTITMAGTSVLIAAGSTVKYHTDAIELSDTSGVAVNTTHGVIVKSNRLTIAPANNSGKYEVARADGTTLIAAKTGAVKVFDGVSTSVVAEGTSTSVADPQAPGATPGATGTGISKKKAGLIVAGLGAVGGATALVILTTDAPKKSPKCPQNQPGNNNCQ